MESTRTYLREWWEVLGVERCASEDEIRKAFRELANRYHPDNNETADEAMFRQVNDAYHLAIEKKV